MFRECVWWLWWMKQAEAVQNESVHYEGIVCLGMCVLEFLPSHLNDNGLLKKIKNWHHKLRL